MGITKIGVIGCGNISDSYLAGGRCFDQIVVKSVADLNAEAALAKAGAYGIQAVAVDDLLADDEIEIVVNLTVPLAHAKVSRKIIDAGKHVYSEKPLAAALTEGKGVMREAKAAGLRVGTAPDTFLGAAHQACRHAIDQGLIGQVVGGAASFLSHGMEHWHPDPTFFYKPGGGPVLDMAPYYLTALVNLIGPVRRVVSETSSASPSRTVTSEGPMTGKAIAVEVPTTVHGILTFANGAVITLSTSWDVWKHERRPIEIYGTKGSMLVPDPNFFGGEPMLCEARDGWTVLDISAFAFGIPNRPTKDGKMVADYRIIGLLDMAAAIRAGRPHRASGNLALHVLEVMDALERSSSEGHHLDIESDIKRPAPLPAGEGAEVFL